MRFIEANGVPRQEDDVVKWAQWFESADRRVARTDISDDVYVSTVFLGLDHSFMDGIPVLYETMIFGGDSDQECRRYCFREQAVIGHNATVASLGGDE